MLTKKALKAAVALLGKEASKSERAYRKRKKMTEEERRADFWREVSRAEDEAVIKALSSSR